MGKRTGPTPEEFAQWARQREELDDYIERRRVELHEWEERRRRRLRLLTFGLLGR
jgi:hypothetical protein